MLKSLVIVGGDLEKKVVSHFRHILVHCDDGTFQDVHRHEIGSVH